MKHLAIAAVIAVLVGVPPVARATNTEGCCACIETASAQTSGFNGTATEALFCAAVDSEDVSSLAQRCVSRSPQAKLLCVANIPGPSCAAQLAGEDIRCPTSDVPAAGPLDLATLAVVLGVLGAILSHRRRGRRTGNRVLG